MGGCAVAISGKDRLGSTRTLWRRSRGGSEESERRPRAASGGDNSQAGEQQAISLPQGHKVCNRKGVRFVLLWAEAHS